MINEEKNTVPCFNPDVPCQPLYWTLIEPILYSLFFIMQQQDMSETLVDRVRMLYMACQSIQTTMMSDKQKLAAQNVLMIVKVG